MNKNSNTGWGTVIGMWFFMILGFVLFFMLALEDQVIAGVVCGLACCLIAVAIFNAGPKELHNGVAQYNQQQEEKRLNGGYKCPSCGHMAGHPISALSKGVSIGTLGLVSNKVGKTYKCENCGYMW